MAVFVLDKQKKPLMPCTEKRARLLLDRGRARIHKTIPFTIRLVDRQVGQSSLQPMELKIDPGASTTGIALVRVVDNKEASDETVKEVVVVSLMEIEHRGNMIRDRLTARANFRRRRRGNLRHRQPRFSNRTKPSGWLAPSLRHRVDTVISWVDRLSRSAPVSGISVEEAKFDTQLMKNPDITGVQYQQGELAGFEVREYLLEKWHHKCAYCDACNVVLNIDHIMPKSKGGSDRVSNLTLACVACNQRKGSRLIAQFLANDPTRLARIQSRCKQPLAAAAAMNATRNTLVSRLVQSGLPVECSTGSRTKFNRSRFSIPKSHAMDAACVGVVDKVSGWHQPTLGIRCAGRGTYNRTRLDRFGFPRGYLTRQKRVKGFATGDHVVACIHKGKKSGIHKGRVAVRATGSFNIKTKAEIIQGLSHKYCTLIQRADGYGYSHIPFIDSKHQGEAGMALSLPSLKAAVFRAVAV